MDSRQLSSHLRGLNVKNSLDFFAVCICTDPRFLVPSPIRFSGSVFLLVNDAFIILEFNLESFLSTSLNPTQSKTMNTFNELCFDLKILCFKCFKEMNRTLRTDFTLLYLYFTTVVRSDRSGMYIHTMGYIFITRFYSKVLSVFLCLTIWV